MEGKELISIVVPIYNVEKYLNRCVDSLINQTYSTIEIILVDDGSTDKSREICDIYGKKNLNLITVIHQENKGLSGARNTGICYAHGKYITFVDSDDWLALDTIELLYNNIKRHNAQISGIGAYKAYENGKLIKVSSKNEVEILTKEEALGKYLFNDNLTVCVWGKLYELSLWNTVKCPEGKLFEDQYTTYKLIDQAERIVFDPIPKYFYFQRKGSIGRSKFSERTYDLYWGVQEQFNYIIKKYPKLQHVMAVAKITWEIVFINMMYSSKKSDKNIISQTRRFAKNHVKEVLFCDEINTVRKIQILLFAYINWLYRMVYIFYKKCVNSN